jgi:hypothetical protein
LIFFSFLFFSFFFTKALWDDLISNYTRCRNAQVLWTITRKRCSLSWSARVLKTATRKRFSTSFDCWSSVQCTVDYPGCWWRTGCADNLRNMDNPNIMYTYRSFSNQRLRNILFSHTSHSLCAHTRHEMRSRFFNAELLHTRCV